MPSTLSRALAGAAVVAVTGATLTVTASAAPELSPGAAPSETTAAEIPVLGQTAVLGARTDGDPLILSVHGVRRVDGGTVVYYSAGFPAGADLGGAEHIVATGGSIGPSNTVFRQGREGQNYCDVGVIDQMGGLVYGPLGEGHQFDSGLCSAAPWAAPGEARVLAAAVAPVPTDVEVVDVSIRGSLIPDVPVEDGPLLPVAEDPGEAPLLGMGWPELDTAAMSAVDPATFIYPLTQSVSDLEGEVNTTAEAVEIAGDVLFEKNSATIGPEGQRVLQAAAEELKAKGVSGELVVIGHTDSDGETAYNLDLSNRRAEAVASALTPLLDSSISLTSEGRGEDEPIASNGTSEGKTLNRRVTLDFTPGEDR